eukprot:CAMPEP_0181069974 /NCGR_PEP_ID=MMETSP1070-20121207/27234_1 /TAXON_ID=265543 /ORGANISM="Minutocellus polymorphus, Strain NH13" /LENGTH=63 /DNA_ID=CAMNT_0023150819 /DNA_START=60 /DNA_END=247 /DNA_ORIENTATION=-
MHFRCESVITPPAWNFLTTRRRVPTNNQHNAYMWLSMKEVGHESSIATVLETRLTLQMTPSQS